MTSSHAPGSATPAAAPPSESRQILVWDVPVRVFHWLLAASFAGAWLSAESERWRLVHVSLGYTMIGLVVFRLLWGVVGSRPARFASFVRGPRAVLAYLRSLRSGQPEHHVGHNPAGGWAILALLGLTLVTTALGWAAYNELGGDALGEAHEWAANLMMAVVGVHVAGVVVASVLHRENLVRAMVTGRKPGRPEDGARRSAWLLGAIIAVAVAAFWTWQWQTAPGGALAAMTNAAAGHGDDDD